MDLDEYLFDKSKYEIVQLEIDRIIEEVKRLGVSYTSEISKNLMIGREKTAALIHRLIIADKLKILVLPPYKVPLPLAKRLLYFQLIGMKHYWQFARCQWVIPCGEEEQPKIINNEEELENSADNREGLSESS